MARAISIVVEIDTIFQSCGRDGNKVLFSRVSIQTTNKLGYWYAGWACREN